MAISKRDLVGRYFQEVDPDLCKELAADGITTTKQLGRYIELSDPAMFKTIIKRVTNQED